MCEYGYTVSLHESGDRQLWIARSLDLPGCIGQGDTLTAAVQELARNEIAWIDTAKQEGIAIPKHSVLPL